VLRKGRLIEQGPLSNTAGRVGLMPVLVGTSGAGIEYGLSESVGKPQRRIPGSAAHDPFFPAGVDQGGQLAGLSRIEHAATGRDRQLIWSLWPPPRGLPQKRGGRT